MHDSLSDDELQEVKNGHATYTSGFASKDDIQDDHCLYDQSRYKKMYDWLYYSQVAHGYMCKICEVFCGKSPVPTGRGRGAWSHNWYYFMEMQERSYDAMQNRNLTSMPFWQ